MRSQKDTYYFARVDINLVNFSLTPPRRWSSRRGARGDERWRGESAESRGSARPSRESERRRPGPSRRPSERSPRPRRGRGAASRRTGGPTGRASGRNACLAIGYGATPRPWASAAGKGVAGSGRGLTSPRSHSEPNINVASDGLHRAVWFDEPGHRLGRRRREGARVVGYVGCPGELT